MDALLEALAAPFALLLLVLAASALDGLFPVVPSETVLLAVAAVSASSGEPQLALVAGAAAVGAVLGDNGAYLLGRRVGTERFRWMRRPRFVAAVDRATREMRRSPARLIIVGRYIPFGRVVVNLTAGAAGVPHRTFFGLSVVAGLSWAAYSTVIAVLAASFVEGNPVLAVALTLAMAVGLGAVADRAIAAATRRRTARTEPVVA